jgi:hypothetical protein
VGDQAGPRAGDDGEKFGAIEDALVDAPGHRISKEGGAGDFRQVIRIGIEETASPQSVFALDGGEAVGHLAKLLDVFRARGVVGGHHREDFDEASHHPAVSARPEDFLAIFLLLGEVAAVAKIEMFNRIVETGGGLPPFLIHKVEVAAIASGDGHFGKNGRRHVERIAPPPEKLGGIVGAAEELVEDLFCVSHSDGIVRSQTGVEIEIHVGFAEGHVVGVGEAVVHELPAKALRHVDHGIVEARVAGGFGCSEETVVKSGVCPEPVECGLGAGEFPGGDLLCGGADGSVT